MKVQEKKSKRKEDVKVLILNAAKKLFLEEGYQSASIRKIAAEIGLSPTTIYLYYKDKSDIAYALHLEGFAILRTLFSALISVESPFERLKATGRIYLKFSVDNPDFYSIMFMMKEPMDFLDSELSEV
jgi:AcrR family transcriptional regulator